MDYVVLAYDAPIGFWLADGISIGVVFMVMLLLFPIFAFMWCYLSYGQPQGDSGVIETQLLMSQDVSSPWCAHQQMGHTSPR